VPRAARASRGPALQELHERCRMSIHRLLNPLQPTGGGGASAAGRRTARPGRQWRAQGATRRTSPLQGRARPRRQRRGMGPCPRRPPATCTATRPWRGPSLLAPLWSNPRKPPWHGRRALAAALATPRGRRSRPKQGRQEAAGFTSRALLRQLQKNIDAELLLLLFAVLLQHWPSCRLKKRTASWSAIPAVSIKYRARRTALRRTASSAGAPRASSTDAARNRRC